MNVDGLWWERRKGGRFGLWWFGVVVWHCAMTLGFLTFRDGVV